MPLPSGQGQPSSRVMIVGDFFSAQEAQMGQSFLGTHGQELNRMLQEAGIMRSDCYTTNAINGFPPHGDIASWIPTRKRDMRATFIPLHDKIVHPVVVEGLEQLKREIALVQPKVIIALGGVALWTLTGIDGIMKWRGSLLDFEGIRLIPTIPPATILRQWELRSAVISDLRRAVRELTHPVPAPAWQPLIRPSFPLAVTTLHQLLRRAESGEEMWLDLDLETSRGHISCCGISWSPTDALVIPLMSRSDRSGYWNEEEETQLVWTLYKLFTHPGVKIRWQNGLYDAQYIHRHWHFIPNHGQDTMISWHVMFAGQKKSLDYQASLLCQHYVQWKPEKSVWKVGG